MTPSAKDVFELFVRDHVRMLRAFILSGVPDPAAADDLLQETLVAAWRKLDRFDRSKPVAPWLRGIAFREILDWRRFRARHRAVSCDEATLALLEEGRPAEIPEAARPRVAQQLFIHALLAERAASPGTEALLRKTLARLGEPAVGRRRFSSAAAAAVIVAAFGGLLLTGDSLPTAEAMIERMDRSFQASVDRHYV